jgi:hypothetical protein
MPIEGLKRRALSLALQRLFVFLRCLIEAQTPPSGAPKVADSVFSVKLTIRVLRTISLA